MTTVDIFDAKRGIISDALRNKKRINAYNDGRICYSRITKQEADGIILDTFDDMVFKYNQLLCSARALEECCKELLRELGKEDDDLTGIYIEKLNEESLNMIKKIESKKETINDQPRFTVIKGGKEKIG